MSKRLRRRRTPRFVCLRIINPGCIYIRLPKAVQLVASVGLSHPGLGNITPSEHHPKMWREAAKEDMDRMNCWLPRREWKR